MEQQNFLLAGIATEVDNIYTTYQTICKAFGEGNGGTLISLIPVPNVR